jgi:hypothetical protein
VAGIGAGRRLLLLSYHFPPSTTTGALRWEKLARFVAERGYGLDVVGLAPESLESRDDARLAALPTGTRFTGVPETGHWAEHVEAKAWAISRGKPSGSWPSGEVTGAIRPGSVAPEQIRWSLRPRDLLRAWWSWKNWARNRRWALAAARRAAGLIQPGVHRAIITCGPPHMVHYTGGRLARRVRLPHIMDLRDPWSLPRRQAEELASPLNFALARRCEAKAVHDAALIVANTDPLRDAMRSRYPERSSRMVTVMNGYDDDELTGPSPGGTRFTVTYAGALYLDRDPRLFLRAAGRMVRSLALTPEQFGIEFLGTGNEFAGIPLRRMSAEEGVAAFLTIHPRRPRTDALAFLAQSTMLLNLPQDSPYAIPSKVFEYLIFPSWILALAAPGSPTALALAGVGVDLVAPEDVDGITTVLTARVQAFLRGERPGPIAGRERLSRASQAKIFLDELDRLLGHGADG